MLRDYCWTDKNDIVIRMPIDAFINGVLHSDYADHMYHWDGKYFKTVWKVTDRELLVNDLLNQLCKESEDGSSILSNTFDHAFESLMEYSYSDGIESEEVES